MTIKFYYVLSVLVLVLMFSCAPTAKKELATCFDRIQNQNETGIDCGGVCGSCPDCFDGTKNQGETGIDCGGPCMACASCTDGIRNQNETKVDCGGVCGACPTCVDGKKNQNETGVDCGGICEPCNTNACNTQLGNGENFYPWETGKRASAIIYMSGDTASNGYGYKCSVTIGFPMASFYFANWQLFFSEKTFLQMPISSTQLFTTYLGGISNTPNTIRVRGMDDISGQKCIAMPDQKVYVTRLGVSAYNIKFCNLVTDEKFQNDSLRISLNGNLILN